MMENLAWEDEMILRLRGLYEKYGYRQYRMGKLEPYDLYRENRNFLVSDTVITFTDGSGRLMALKPDVTMSIIKNTPPEAAVQKLHYNENVFRTAPGTREYREIRQVGLEYIGCGGGYDEAETVLLALKSLALVHPDHVLLVSHMGLLSALLAQCGIQGEDVPRALDALRHRNRHELKDLAAAAGLTREGAALLDTAAALSSPIPQAAEALYAAGLQGPGAAALGELTGLYDALAPLGYGDKLVMDLTVVNDMDYYNGLVFQGYIQGVPRAALAGGRYDNLMRRFGKGQPAMGFALYIGELERAFTRSREYDAEVLLLTGGMTPGEALLEVERLVAGGHSVLAAESAPENARVKTVRRMDGGQEEAE